ncbi:hypothetical protein [Parasitella parasitica]|uniref:F-box domain-containing protein n=1 Tax=Parasitella parasitica TaxID=35722 RepID=A0A0B7NHY4_9FUNG|nr:hypothetical protein [Parasitella parasitica]
MFNLPFDVLLSVFDFVDDSKQLMQCRLVCKSWKAAALQVALCKPLLIESEAQLLGFSNFLVTHEDLVSYVRHLTITNRSYYDAAYAIGEEDLVEDEENLDEENLDEENPFKKILPLVFHEKLEILGGNLDDTYSYRKILEIVAHSQKRFRLKKMPDPANQESNDYKMAALFFKETLVHVYLLVSIEPSDADIHFFSSLQDFRCLTSIALTVEQVRFPELKTIVDGCPLLQEMDIGWVETQNDMTTEQVRQWFTINDSRNDLILKTVKVSNCFSSNFIEYLALKYRKIEEVSIDMSSYVDHVESLVANNIVHENVIIRVINAMNDNVSMYDIKFFPHRRFNPLEQIIYAITNLGQTVEISGNPDDRNMLAITVTPVSQD